MKNIQIIGILLLLINSIAYGQTKQDKAELLDKSNEWKVLSGDNYEIKYPDNWDVDTSGQMGTHFIILSKAASVEDKFRENVNLLIQDLSRYNLTLDQYVELSENQIVTMITDGELILSERQKSKDFEYHQVVYTGKQSGFDLKFEQYYWVIDNEAFVLTFTCDVNEFDTYQSTGEKILNSFAIKK